MKVFAILAAVAVASVNAAQCDLTALAPLLQDTDLTGCVSKSGLKFPPTEALTQAVITKACTVKECANLLAKVEAKKLGDCEIASFKIETDIINPIKKTCGASFGAASNTTTTTTSAPSASSGSSAGTEIEAPATTTPAPTTSGSSAGSSSPVAAVTTTPTPSKSGASAVSVAFGAATAAVVAAMW